jgi:hypothetical protein
MKRFCSFSTFVFVASTILFSLSHPARAQTAIYGAFSGASISSGPTNSAFGALFGLYAQSGHYAYFGGDFRGSVLTRNGFDFYSGAVGPRLAFKPPILPLRPYIEGLVGAAIYNSGRNTSSDTHLNYHAVVGLDMTILPRVDWRVLEYDYSGTTGPVKAHIFSTGLALRLW